MLLESDYETGGMNMSFSKKFEMYSKAENVIGMLLWSLVFYVTVFNMVINSTKSILFMHMRIIWSPYTIIYAFISIFMIILCNFILSVRRNLITQVFSSFISCGITAAIFYMRTNAIAMVVIIAMVPFIILCIYRVVSYLKSDKAVDNSAELKKKHVSWIFGHTFIQLGILSMLFCIILGVSQKFIVWTVRSNEKDTASNKIYSEYDYFRAYVRENKEIYETLASDEYIKYMINDGHFQYGKVEEQLQTFSDSFMTYLGTESRPEIILTESLIGDDMDSLELPDDGDLLKAKILISKKFVEEQLKKGSSEYYLIYEHMYAQNLRLYHMEVANAVKSDEYKDSNLMIFRQIKAWEVENDEIPYGMDNELISKDYDIFSSRVGYDTYREAFDYACDTDDVINDREQ